MTLFMSVIINIIQDDASLSVIKIIYQRWHFLEALLLANTYNDRAEEGTLEKRHFLPFLTHKKRHYFSFFL